MLGWRLCLMLLMLSSLLMTSDDARGQGGGPKGGRPMQKPGQPRPFSLTPEREAAVSDFVERNHPELAQLLSHLKANQPKEYERAVRDLFRVTEKLAMVHERDSRQYALELKAWQAQSRAQLLVARMKMGDSSSAEELKKQLREILAEQYQARLEILRLERDRVTGRLNKLDADINRLERDRDAAIEGHLKSLTNAGGAGSKAKQRSPGQRTGELRTGEPVAGEKKSLSPAASVKQPGNRKPD